MYSVWSDQGADSSCDPAPRTSSATTQSGAEAAQPEPDAAGGEGDFTLSCGGGGIMTQHWGGGKGA